VTKKDLVRSVAEGLDVDQRQAPTIVQRVLDTVLATLAAQGRVELRNFGVFEVKRRAARQARNPQTGEKVMYTGYIGQVLGGLWGKHVIPSEPVKST
jgi:nucleoid DNA-binding protein